MISLVGLSTAPLRLLDLGSVKQRRDDRGRADADRDAGLYQLGPSFVVSLIVVAHHGLAKLVGPRPYAEEGCFGSGKAVSCAGG